MKRREFIRLIGGAVSWPVAARAQLGEPVRRIAVLTGYDEDDREAQERLAILRRRLAELGWTNGRNLQIEERWSRGDAERARRLAEELIGWKPDVILAETTSSVRALRLLTDTIPIVFTNLSNPVGSGFVASLSRPGGNITGFTNYESSMGGKWLQILKDVVPGTTRAAIMFNPNVSTHIAAGYYLDSLAEAAPGLAVTAVATPVQTAGEIERAVAESAAPPGGGLIVLPDTFTLVHRDLIVRLAAEQRVPAVYSFRLFAAQGGLLSYGINASNQFSRAASYIDRILKGERTPDLPVQTPTKYELIINLKTAKTLGLDVPPSLLARADEVIE